MKRDSPIAPDVGNLGGYSFHPFELHRAAFDRVPFPGGGTDPTGPGRLQTISANGIPLIDTPTSTATMVARMGTDATIGLIPVVGDAVDLLELGWAAMTGRDRWGQQVGLLDIALMGIGAALPFVSSQTVRRLGTAVLIGGATAGFVAGGEERSDSE
jgi:hypothetical protein